MFFMLDGALEHPCDGRFSFFAPISTAIWMTLPDEYLEDSQQGRCMSDGGAEGIRMSNWLSHISAHALVPDSPDPKSLEMKFKSRGRGGVAGERVCEFTT
jgi:hypothetical protein